ncbi:ABC transporter ATP-binding protein [Candidatus Zixiibacteriota bacterium]
MHTVDVDDVGKAFDPHLMRRLLVYLKPYRGWVAISVVLMFVGSIISLAGPTIAQIAIDRFIDPQTADGISITERLRGMNVMALLLLGTVIGGFLFMYLQLYLMNLTGQKAMYDLRTDFYAHLLRLPLSYYDRSSVGWILTRLTNDVEALNNMFTSGVVAIFGDLFMLAGIIGFMFYQDARLTMVVMIILPVLFVATLWFRTRARDSYREVRSKLGRLNSFLQENLMGIRVVQIFTREKNSYERFREINRQHLDANLKTIFYYALFFPGVGLISALVLAVLIWFGGGWVIDGSITFGVLYAFILYVQRFYRPIRDLAEKYNIMQSAMAASERIFKLMDEPATIASPEDPRTIPEFRGRIEFQNVWFRYENEPTRERTIDDPDIEPVVKQPERSTDWVLKDISFTVEPGQTVAIVGHTGAGKTTITSLLGRFYDIEKGRILIDGVDIREMDLERLRDMVGVVQQDVFLFSGTIGGNISLEDVSISAEEVERAARHVNADPFIQRLPEGYDAEVVERGATLSTGQRQLLSFARALAFDPSVLVLDEATSSVDTDTEVLIQDALDKLMADRSTIVIAHRLSTIQKADRIIVLHKGEIRESGTHQELLAMRGIYHCLYLLQYQTQNGSDDDPSGDVELSCSPEV